MTENGVDRRARDIVAKRIESGHSRQDHGGFVFIGGFCDCARDWTGKRKDLAIRVGIGKDRLHRLAQRFMSDGGTLFRIADMDGVRALEAEQYDFTAYRVEILSSSTPCKGLTLDCADQQQMEALVDLLNSVSVFPSLSPFFCLSVFGSLSISWLLFFPFSPLGASSEKSTPLRPSPLVTSSAPSPRTWTAVCRRCAGTASAP